MRKKVVFFSICYVANLGFMSQVAGSQNVGVDASKINHKSIYRSTSRHPGDARVRRTKNSPKWMEAIGRITRDGRHRCSGTLVSLKEGQASQYVLTAAHCPHQNDLINFTTADGRGITRKIVSVPFSEHNKKKYDIALARLDRKVDADEVVPLVLFELPEELSFSRTEFEYYLDYEHEGEVMYVAGYSADSFGMNGQVLTYTEHRDSRESPLAAGYKSNDKKALVMSATSPGASGGPVVTEFKYKDKAYRYLTAVIKGTIQSREAGKYAEGPAGAVTTLSRVAPFINKIKSYM